MTHRHGLSASLILLALVPSIASAREGEKAPLPPALARLAECKALSDDAARLACYDREAQVLTASIDKGDIKVVDREEATSMRKSLFGFTLPKLGLFGGGDDDTSNEDITLLDSTITSLTSLPRGRWQFTIAEGGARWETIDAPSRLIAPKIGEKVQLEKAALGSYWIRFNGQRGVKGRRFN